MFCVSCDKTFSRRDVMLRHFRNKHGTSQPYPQNHHAYPPPPPSPSPIQTYQQSRRHRVYPPPPPPPPSPMQTWISTVPAAAAAATTAAAAATNENGFRFRHPFTANITGPTGCGKTHFVKALLQNCRTKMAPTPQRIVWLYKRWQPLYDEISRTVVPRVEFVRGIPSDLDGDHYFDPRIRNVIVLDDLMSTAAKDPRINDLFTEGSHHRNLSVVTLNQNLFFGKDPTQRRNCHYLVLFKNPIDRQPIATLGRQMYPGRAHDFLQKFEEVTKEPYSYLVVDLKPETPEWRRLCTNIFEEEASDDMQTDRTMEDTDQMDTLEEDILSDQMDTSDDDMQSNRMDSLEEDSLPRGDEDMEGGGRQHKRRKVETGMTNLQIESCLKGYPAIVCCADELPDHVGVRPLTFIVNTDTCDRGGSHWVAFHFPLVGPAEFFDSLGNAPETYHRRFANVLIVNGPQYYYCSSQIQPDDTDTCGLYCLYYFKRRHRGMELPDIVKDFSTVDLKGNEDKILRSDC